MPKGSTRRRQMREWQTAVHTAEGWRTVRYAITSAFQGDPVAAMCTVDVIAGGFFRAAGALASQAKSPHITVLEDPLKEVGLGLFAIAGVEEGGKAIGDVISAIRGNPRPPVAYDVSDAAHSEAVAVQSGGGLSFPANPLAKPGTGGKSA